jgi:hypothetical protein
LTVTAPLHPRPFSSTTLCLTVAPRRLTAKKAGEAAKLKAKKVREAKPGVVGAEIATEPDARKERRAELKAEGNKARRP